MDKLDLDPGEERLVRGAVTMAMVITELGQHPSLRNMRPQERVFSQTLTGLTGWDQPSTSVVRFGESGALVVPERSVARDVASVLSRGPNVFE